MKSDLHVSKEQINGLIRSVRKYAVFAFLLFLIAIYGFLSLRVTQLLQAEPDSVEVTAELKTMGIPEINEEVVSKMEKLEDNSVSAQTLFDEARSNPFQE